MGKMQNEIDTKIVSKITVVGAGYVGLSLAVLLAAENSVTILEISSRKIEQINSRKSPISDRDIECALKAQSLHLLATSDSKTAYKDTDLVILALPTDFNPITGSFDMSLVENVIDEIIEFNTSAVIVIKSTCSFGFSESMQRKYPEAHIIFSPEFLREGHALYDNLHPSRIVVGHREEDRKYAEFFAGLLSNASISKVPEICFMSTKEAEAVKLFSNTYLAMRVAYFNELDTFSMANHLEVKNILHAVCLDERIQNHYNNPSFGYGGYCLPKDTKQLQSSFGSVPQVLTSATIQANEMRKQFLADDILKRNPGSIGIYKLAMKADSDNYRSSSIIDIIRLLKDNPVKIYIYEPMIQDKEFEDCRIENDFDAFCNKVDIVIANRWNEQLSPIRHKVYTRDLFGIN